MSSAFHLFQKLDSNSLEALSQELVAESRDALSSHSLGQIVGSTLVTEFAECLGKLRTEGWSNHQLAVVATEIRETRRSSGDVENLFDVVLTGPDVPGVPTRDTAAVVHTLIEEAEIEIMLVGYAVHNGRQLFQHLANRMAERPEIRVDFLLNVPRRFNDTSLDSEILRRFSAEFTSKHWPWVPRPEVYYDPRSLNTEASKRASLHAKCVIVDRKKAMVTSANFTEAAQRRNVEAGVLVSYSPFVQRIAEYFLGLKATELRRCILQ